MNGPAHESDELDRADMLRLASGHDAALNELIERHSPKLFNYLVRTKFRHRSRHPELSLEAANPQSDTKFRETIPAEQPTPSESLQNSESSDAVRRAIADLPEELRTSLILSEYEELSHAEIGAILNCSPKAVE